MSWILKKDQEFGNTEAYSSHKEQYKPRPEGAHKKAWCIQETKSKSVTTVQGSQRPDRLGRALWVMIRSLDDKEPNEDLKQRTQDNFAINFGRVYYRGGDLKEGQ